MTIIFSGRNYCGMENTHIKRGPGRPPKFDRALERVEILVPHQWREDAARIAAETGQTISAVYREWIASGRSEAKNQ